MRQQPMKQVVEFLGSFAKNAQLPMNDFMFALELQHMCEDYIKNPEVPCMSPRTRVLLETALINLRLT